MMSADLTNSTPSSSTDFIDPSPLTSVFKLALQSLPVSSKLLPQDVQFLTDLVENSTLLKDIIGFVCDQRIFTLHHIPELILFITIQLKGPNKKRTQYNLLECIRFIANTVLLSHIVPFSATDQLILSKLLDESITLLQTNLQKPKRSFFFSSLKAESPNQFNEQLNEPYVDTLSSKILSILQLDLQQQIAKTNTQLTPQDAVFLKYLMDNTKIVTETLRFLAELKQFKILHVPQFVLFLTEQFKTLGEDGRLDKKKIAYNTLECVRFFSHAVLMSNFVGLNATDLAILSDVLDASFTLLEYNLQKPNSHGCFYFF